MTKNTCIEDACDRPALARRLCSAHYQRRSRLSQLPERVLDDRRLPMTARRHGSRGTYNDGCRCARCHQANLLYKREQYRLHGKAQNDRKAAYRAAHREEKRAYDKAHRELIGYDASEMRTRHLYRRFKLTPEQFHAMELAQGGRCAICGKPPSTQVLVIDHDHACCPGPTTCGKCIRGLLCRSCNSFLGRVNDNLLSAIAYLARTRAA